MEDREQKSGNVGCFIMGMLGLVGLPLYVLSIGPVSWVVLQNPSLQWIGVIYFPLGLLAEFCPPVESALQWYLELWQ